jgi:hypothetical protein
MTERTVKITLPVAGIFGAMSGTVAYHFFLPDWFPAIAMAATYAGAAYFMLRSTSHLSGDTLNSRTVPTDSATQSTVRSERRAVRTR